MKRIICLLFVLLILAVVPAHSAVLVLSSNGSFVTKPGLTLTSAATSSDCIGKKVVITSPQSLTADITWPADRELSFESGGVITVTSGKTLTYNSSTKSWPLRQVISGAGTTPLLLSASHGDKVYTEWLGAKADAVGGSAGTSTGTDCTLAFTQTINAIKQIVNPITLAIRSPMSPIQLLSGNYLINGSVSASSVQFLTIQGSGAESTRIIHSPTSANSDCFVFDTPYSDGYNTGNTIKDLTIVALSANSRYLLAMTGPNELLLENLQLLGGYDTAHRYALRGVDINTGMRCTFRNVRCILFTQYGIAYISGATSVSTTQSFYSCYFGQNGKSGVFVDKAISTAFYSCVFEGNEEYGIDMGFSEGASIILIGGHFEDTRVGAIRAGNAAFTDTAHVSNLKTIGVRFLGNAANGGSITDPHLYTPAAFMELRNTVYTGIADEATEALYAMRYFSASALTKKITVFGSPTGYYTDDYTPLSDNEFPVVGFRNQLMTGFEARTATGASTNISGSRATLLTLASNTNIEFVGSGLIPGESLKLMMVQSGDGTYTVTFNSAYKTTYSNSGNSGGKKCVINFVWDGNYWLQESIQQWF